MSTREHPVAVDLRAAVGSENPPCPACGDPLFGWAVIRPGIPVRRCETCGLGVAGPAAERSEALAGAGRPDPQGARRVPNRAGLAAWLGGSGWAALSPETRLIFSPQSLARLGIGNVRSRPAPALMWQTVLNSFTFGHNVALGRLGRAAAIPAPKRWQRLLDGFISVALAAPVMLIAAPLELGAVLLGRGGVLQIRPKPEP